jgi:ABC-type transport system substrate-binding protein
MATLPHQHPPLGTHPRRRFLLAAAGLSAGAWLAACGGGSTAKTPTPAGSAAAEPASVRGGTLRLPVVFTSGHFDIHQFQTGYQMGIWRSCANGLFTIDPATGDPVGDLAKSWSFPDPTTLVVQLKPEARWQRTAPLDGRPVTAADVKFSIERLATKSAEFVRSSDYALVDRVEAPDDHTVTIRLTSPFVPLVNLLANFQAVVVAPEVVQKFGDLKKPEAIIGSGPFKVERADASTGARVVRNPDYWEPGLPYLDAVEWTIVNDQQTSLAAFRTGKFHLHDLDAIDVPSFAGNTAVTVQPYLNPSYFVQGLGGPTDGPPLNDPRVRQAIDLTIDRDALGKVANPGAKFTLSSVFAHPRWSLPADEVSKRPGFRAPKDQDLAEAKKLVSAAGDGLMLTIMTSPQYPAFYIDRAQVFKAQLEKVGFKVEIDPNEYTAFKDRERAKRFQLTTGTWGFYNDPDAALSGAFAKDGARNYFSYSGPQFEALLAKERAEPDPAKRKAIVLDAQRLLLDDRPLAAFTGWFVTANMGVQAAVRGAKFGGTPPSGVNAGEQAYQSKMIWLAS